jgi:DNA polymerase III subunit gamma/tau
MSSNQPFHTKYRPRTLDKVIGQEKIVERLTGIVKSKKVPNALLFVGPSSAGKTTLARAFTAELFGVKDLSGSQDYHEINAADSRGIDDLRDLLKISKLKPRIAPRRVILVDECQQLTGPSAQLLLKPLEDPPPTTLFILCSMEPEKMLQAMKNRCSQFVLQVPEKAHIVKFIRRIAKGEDMRYVTEDIAGTIAENSNGELRSAANLLEALSQSVAGSGSKKVTAKDINEALATAESLDDQLAVRILTAVYANKFRTVQRDLLDVQDPFKLIGSLIRLNSFLMNSKVLKGDSHKSVWWSQVNKDVSKGVKEYGKIEESTLLTAYAIVQNHLVDLRLKSGGFLLPETVLTSACLFNATKELKPLYAKS